MKDRGQRTEGRGLKVALLLLLLLLMCVAAWGQFRFGTPPWVFVAKPVAVASTPFVTGQTLGTLRNLEAWVGTRIVVGGSDITVTHLARWVVSGNSGTHTVKVMDGNYNPLIGGSVIVDTSGASVGFKYVALASPITLTNGATYTILSQEAVLGDQFYDGDTTINVTGVATVSGAAFDDTICAINGSAGTCYVPVSFKYSSP